MVQQLVLLYRKYLLPTLLTVKDFLSLLMLNLAIELIWLMEVSRLLILISLALMLWLLLDSCCPFSTWGWGTDLNPGYTFQPSSTNAELPSCAHLDQPISWPADLGANFITICAHFSKLWYLRTGFCSVHFIRNSWWIQLVSDTESVLHSCCALVNMLP